MFEMQPPLSFKWQEKALIIETNSPSIGLIDKVSIKNPSTNGLRCTFKELHEFNKSARKFKARNLTGT